MRTSDQHVAAYTWLRTRDVATRWGLAKTDLVCELIRTGAFPDVDGKPGVINIGAGDRVEYRIRPESVDAFEASRAVRSEGEAA